MPPQRGPLGPISGNRLLGAHLSPYARGVIAGKASAGANPSEIAAELKGLIGFAYGAFIFHFI
jgi:hypothetical protein